MRKLVRPGLPRSVAPSARVNLNLYWDRLEEYYLRRRAGRTVDKVTDVNNNSSSNSSSNISSSSNFWNCSSTVTTALVTEDNSCTVTTALVTEDNSCTIINNTNSNDVIWRGDVSNGNSSSNSSSNSNSNSSSNSILNNKAFVSLSDVEESPPSDVEMEEEEAELGRSPESSFVRGSSSSSSSSIGSVVLNRKALLRTLR